MVEELSTDYANYLMNTSISREVSSRSCCVCSSLKSAYLMSLSLIIQVLPICSNIDEMILRLEELESLLINIVKSDTQVTRQFIPQLVGFREEFKDISQRVDSFENLLRVINRNVSIMEQHVEVAAEELGYTEKGLKGLLKPLFREQRRAGEAAPTNLDSAKNYVPVEVFQAADYFPDSSSC